MNTYTVRATVEVTVHATSEGDAESIAHDHIGVAAGAPDTIEFITLDIVDVTKD